MDEFEITFLYRENGHFEYYDDKDTPRKEKTVRGRILGTESIRLSCLDRGQPGNEVTGVNILVGGEIVLIRKSWIIKMENIANG